MNVKAVEVVKVLMRINESPGSVNDSISLDMCELVGAELGLRVAVAKPAFEDVQSMAHRRTGPQGEPRNPVVTVMGHVNHGKTTLLDALRSASVAEGEAGGITQHISVFRAAGGTDAADASRRITFMDTPGHGAFSKMRHRGAAVTDILVLVVACDDGVQPQTREVIRLANEHALPTIVALNKVDRDGMDQETIKTELAEAGLTDVIDYVPVSALFRRNLDELREVILVQAELMDLRAEVDCPAEAVVVESFRDRHHGSSAVVVVRCGQLEVGQYVVCGDTWGRVRSLMPTVAEQAPADGPAVDGTDGLPSCPAVITGLRSVVKAGDVLIEVESEARAKEIVRQRRLRKDKGEAEPAAPARPFATMDDDQPRLSLIVRTDVDGSYDAIRAALDETMTLLLGENHADETVDVRIVPSSGAGQVTESDVELAAVTGAHIFAFNTGVSSEARAIARSKNIEIRSHDIIYKVLDDVHDLVADRLAPHVEQETIGEASVKQIFTVSGRMAKNSTGHVAGCVVTRGQVTRGTTATVVRDGKEVASGHIVGLRHFKNEVGNVDKGQECGIMMDGKAIEQIKPGDVVQVFKVVETRRKIGERRRTV